MKYDPIITEEQCRKYWMDLSEMKSLKEYNEKLIQKNIHGQCNQVKMQGEIEAMRKLCYGSKSLLGDLW